MIKIYCKVLYPLLLLLIISNLYSQELPPIEKFTPENYAGGNQNWMISQASNKFIYVANNEGLLEYNGANWKLYSTPNNTIIRAVNVVNDRVYTGCYMEFGYWQKDTYGILQYISLVQNLDVKMIEDEHFWNIVAYEEWVLFQSFNRIYFYNTVNNKFTIIDANNPIAKVFNINGVIYYSVQNEGFYSIEEGKSKLISNEPVFKEGIIINISPIDNGLLIQTRGSGFYIYKNNIITEWNIQVNETLKRIKVFTSLQLKDKSFVIGTISNGIIYLSKEGKIQYQINQNNGLSNNTALSLFEDVDGNIWVGLDNGINCINIEKTPVRILNDDKGILGTVYASVLFNNYLYLGTNQGLFYKKADTNESFKIINGTAGQVWSLFVFNNELFCGHHLGTYLIDKNDALQITDKPGTWNFKAIPTIQNALLQGNYNGLNILIKENGKWRFRNKIKGFDNSARFFEFLSNNVIFVSHEYKGVFKLMVDEDFTSISNISIQSELPIGKNSSIVKFKNNILFALNRGIYKYNSAEKKFLRDSVLSPIVTNETYLSGKLIVDETQKMWAFSKDNISYVSINDITSEFKIHTISIPSHLRKGMIGYENISHIENNKYLLGTTSGYIILDISLINPSDEYTIQLNSISLKRIDTTDLPIDLNKKGEFKYRNSSIIINYSVPVYDKYQKVRYQYKLIGYYDNWSDWTDKTELFFDNLPFGEYSFLIRAKVGNKLTENIADYNFKILKPWYLSNSAIITYILSLFALILFIHKRYKRYYKTQLDRKQKESERLIMSIKNEKLNQDIENKNRELAISTMSIINKNEVLNSIKKELKNNELDKNNNAVLKLIEGNLNNSKDWKFFEEAFNNADKFFLDKIKMAHPNLTPNDLRFCAYLRLNLSSKEIAPLLNISVRSVETKRYRLRKQMNLAHDESLVTHILEI